MNEVISYNQRDVSAAFVLPESLRGRDTDLPLPCAVFEVDVDVSAGVAVDSRYVYATEEYCRAISRDVEGIVGRSYLEIGEGDKSAWLEQCYRVVACGETVNGFGYDSLVRDWTCFTLAPSAMAGCCVYTFMRMAVDDQQRKQLMATADAKTSLFISEMLSELAAEQSYPAAMNGMLRKMSEIIHTDRLSVFECNGDQTTITFERLSTGVESQLGWSFTVTREMLSYWFRNVTRDRVVLVPNVSIIQRVSEPLYKWCRYSGVNSLLAAPFFSDGEIVGFLGAYNYRIDDTVDLNRLFEAVATFIAARIENRQLIDSLKQASTHDTLTGLLNRRGSRAAIEELLAAGPGTRHVLALMDVDDFKRVNDIYGHDAGDEALRAMARTLKRVFPPDAIVSRNGGDEFLVMLSGDAAEETHSLLSRLTHNGVEFDFEGERHQLTVSVGYARYPEQASDMRRLLSAADAALYAVKLSGKAGFREYAPNEAGHTRLKLGFSAHDILEGAPYPLLVSMADDQGEILFASNELARLLGYNGIYDLMRTTGGLYAGIVHPSDRERVRMTIEQVSQCAKGCSTETFALCMMAKDGSIQKVHASFQFVEIEDTGRVLYSYFIPE